MIDPVIRALSRASFSPGSPIRGILQSVSIRDSDGFAPQLLLPSKPKPGNKKVAHGVSPQTIKRIKKEFKMSLVATTITEHYYNEGMIAGRIKGKEEGKEEGIIEGEIKGEIKNLEKMYQFGVLTEAQYNQFMKPLKEQLQRLQASQEGQSV